MQLALPLGDVDISHLHQLAAAAEQLAGQLSYRLEADFDGEDGDAMIMLLECASGVDFRVAAKNLLSLAREHLDHPYLDAQAVRRADSRYPWTPVFPQEH